MTNKPTELVVTQADRNAAKKHFQLNPTDFFDVDRLTNAFAAHRLASTAPASDVAGDEVERFDLSGHFPTGLRARHYGEVIIPRELFDFLMGTGEIDGCGFGDLNGLPGRFWWRALLATCDSRGDPTPMEE